MTRQSYKDYEVIVVDNDSRDGSKELVKKDFPSVILIENKENVGAAEARNQALRIAKGDCVWFLDSDSEVIRKDCLKNMLSILKKNPSIGQLGGEVILEGGKHLIRLSNSSRNQDGTFLYIKSCKMNEAEYIPTSNCIMKKDLLFRTGGFDPEFIYGYEDNQVGFKVRELGYRAIVDDSVLAYHHISKAGRLSHFFRFHRNRIRFLILKERPWYIALLPFMDLYYMAKLFPVRVKEMRQRNLEDVAWLNKEASENTNNVNKVLTLTYHYSKNLLLAYLWNLYNFPKTLSVRIKKPNFILK